MKIILYSIFISLFVGIGGLFFIEVFSIVMNGLTTDVARIIGASVYCSMVMVVCTGVILSKLKS